MTYNFSYIYPQMEEETKRQASVRRFVDRKLSFQCFENAYVLPSKDLWKDGKCFGGVVTNDGHFVESSAWHEGKRCDKYDFDPSKAQRDESIVIYMGFYFSCWGHAITDNLKKLWFLEAEECKELLSQGAKLIYLTTDNLPQPNYVKQLFKLAGVDLDKFELINQVTCFEKVVVPDNSFVADNGQRVFTDSYVKTIDKIKFAVSSSFSKTESLPQKIYFTRTHLKSLRDWGECSIECAFEKKGYKVIAPEELAVEKQIALLMNCSHFATTEGSISHNVVFCKSGTEVAIVRKCFDVNKYQMALNEVSDVNVTIIDAHHSTKAPKEAPWVGPFYMYRSTPLKDFLHLSSIEIPFWFRVSWIMYYNQDSKFHKRMRRLIEKVHNNR